MPTYLDMTRIDWHVDATPAELHPALVAANERCMLDDHTLDSLRRTLEDIGHAHPELTCDGLVDDGFNQFMLLHLAGGRVTVRSVEERPLSGVAPEHLPYDELITIMPARDAEGLAEAIEEVDPDAFEYEDDDGALVLPCDYESEAQLRALADRAAAAIDEGGGSCIAEVDGTRYLVEVAPERARVVPLEVVTEPALVARLRAGTFTPVPRLGRDPKSAHDLAVTWPASLLDLLDTTGQRVGRTAAFLVQYAWKLARPRIAVAADRAALDAAIVHTGLPVTPTRTGAVRVAGTILDDLEAEAKRLGVDVAHVLAAAVALSRQDLEEF